MIKKITKSICNLIHCKLKFYRDEWKKRQERKKFSEFMRISNSVRTNEKEAEVIVDYLDTQRIGHIGVNPTIIRPFGLKRE
ncbi:hypothetical protein ACPUYX_13810 [Desulfosporosinus sp. SYSU MS00001]|uniref:hypothetical protein n=1 Tax=Desulfosporosinus sp. SYSU MS00001 TaxID=3416284 RepID=UPI003CF54B1B